ncbi:MAG: electron transport complex subunit RsxC [Treponema sp.]|jgi:electron transport complex protein RnfC|nr:electron transport complex subunit RsxC [Treponema sp.]
MSFTFRGGIHPKEQKQYTENVPINYLTPAEKAEMVFPLLQHLGSPCQPIVGAGQKVLLGEKIGDSDAYISSPIHSSISGTVKDIRPHMTAMGTIVNSIIIENDGELLEHETIKPKDYNELTREEIISIIREKGIVGLGGAGFPAHVKLSPPAGKEIDTVIINGSECEPYLTTDNRVMIEEADRLVIGVQIILKVLKNARAVIAIEDNKPEAIEALKKACGNIAGIDVAACKTKYPQGAEKQLIWAITKREVPSGGLPADAGCVVNNIDTVIAIHRAFIRGRPLMRKVVTLSGGAIRNPGNYKVRLGTKVNDLVELAGGFKANPVKVVVGGPLMGTAIFDINVPIVKTTSGVLFLTEKEAYIPPEQNCIRCGKCVERCPMGLVPTELNTDVLRENSELFVKHNGLECIECGSCSYICPAKRRLSQAIRTTRRVELAKLKNKG